MKASTKKLLSLLVVVAMVLAMAPAITLTASAAAPESMGPINEWITDNDGAFNTAEALETPGNVQATCPVCGTMQTWTPWTSGSQLTLVGHYYLANDITCTATANYFTMDSGTTACLYLNDHTINTMGKRGRIYGKHSYDCAVSIIGDNDGKIICTAEGVTYGATTSTTSSYGVIDVNNLRTLRIYGGTYINDQAKRAGGSAGVAMFTSTGGNVKIYGGTFEANEGTVSTANVTLYGGTFDFNPQGVDNVTLATGYEPTKNSDNSYTVANPNAAPDNTAAKKQAVDTWRTENASKFTNAAEAEDEVDAFCPCCWKDVTWLPLNPSDGLPDNAEGHYYVTGKGTLANVTTGYAVRTKDSATASLCLYLNNKELTLEDRFRVRCNVNLIGDGEFIRANKGTATATLLMWGENGQLNIYGGTYTNKFNLGMIGISTAGVRVNIYDGSFISETYNNFKDPDSAQGIVKIYQATFETGPNAAPDYFGGNTLSGNATYTGNITTWYPEMSDALTAAANSNGTKAIRMYNNGELNLGGGSVYVDCNGKTVTVTNGTLYGFESTGASSIYGVRGGGWIIGNDVTIVRDVRFGGNRYVTLNNVGEQTGANAGKLTATSYRYNLDVTAIALRTGNAGLYYKTTLRAAPALANRIKAYGVVLSLDSMPGANWEGSAKTAATCIDEAVAMDGNTATFNSGILANIMKAGEDNAARGEMDIYANAYLKFDFDCDEDYLDEQYIMAVADSEEDVVCNMQNVMETINDRWENYAPAEGAEINAQDTVADFYTKWNMSGFNWALDNIADYVASKNA